MTNARRRMWPLLGYAALGTLALARGLFFRPQVRSRRDVLVGQTEIERRANDLAQHEAQQTMSAPFDRESPSVSAMGSTFAFLSWSSIFAGAVVAAVVSSVLVNFGFAIGLAMVSPSATWRDTSSVLALLGGLWLLLTSLASFGLGAYLAGVLRQTLNAATPHEVGFRDGVHGLLVWGVAILIGAALTFATPRTTSPRPDGTVPTTSNAESFLAVELDRLMRSDRTPGDANANDSALRAQAARIIFSGLGRTGVALDDRGYLVRAVMMRTGLAQPQAEARVDKAFADSKATISRARRVVVILAFMIGASAMIGAAIAWLAAAAGGKHRDGSITHDFWHRWEVNRLFFIR
jgi:hypothetical protein